METLKAARAWISVLPERLYRWFPHTTISSKIINHRNQGIELEASSLLLSFHSMEG